MVAIMNGSGDVEPSCAICGAPPFPECPHEAQRLEIALSQAMQRWTSMQAIKDWVLNQARNQILATFQHLKSVRQHAHVGYLQTLPCYSLYLRFPGNPPIPPQQLALLHNQIYQANAVYKQGIDEDWRRSCLRYPEVLDYYFSLVEVSWPDERDPAIREPKFGGAVKRVKAKRESMDATEKQRKKDKRGGHRTPPPTAPMPGRYSR